MHGRVDEVHPDEQYVSGVTEDGQDSTFKLEYDYIILATGPKLDFGATEGLGPMAGKSWSICNPPHAIEARDHYLESVARMQAEEKQRIVIGTGHGGAPCQGAALEYITNVHKDLVRREVRDKAELVYMSNERELGDFGIRGVSVMHRGKMTTGADFIGAVFKDYGIEAQVSKSVTAVGPGAAQWENAEGEKGETKFDYAMLIPRFTGVDMKYLDKDGNDVSDEIVDPARLVKVDAIYGLPYDKLEQNPDAWPAVYQNPALPEHFCCGHFVCSAGADLSSVHQSQRTATEPRTAAHRYGVGHHRAHRGAEHHRPRQKRPHDPQRTHDRDGRGLYRLNGRLTLGRFGSGDHGAPRGT